jgi:hypothetical protein
MSIIVSKTLKELTNQIGTVTDIIIIDVKVDVIIITPKLIFLFSYP